MRLSASVMGLAFSRVFVGPHMLIVDKVIYPFHKPSSKGVGACLFQALGW